MRSSINNLQENKYDLNYHLLNGSSPSHPLSLKRPSFHLDVEIVIKFDVIFFFVFLFLSIWNFRGDFKNSNWYYSSDDPSHHFIVFILNLSAWTLFIFFVESWQMRWCSSAAQTALKLCDKTSSSRWGTTTSLCFRERLLSSWRSACKTWQCDAPGRCQRGLLGGEATLHVNDGNHSLSGG